MSQRKRTFPVPEILAGAVLVLSSCGSSTTSNDTATSELATSEVQTSGAAPDVTAGAQAAKWASNVTITYRTTTFTFTSDGLPSHELPDQYLIPDGQPTDPNTKFVPQDTKANLKGSTLNVEIPLKPVYSPTVTKTSLGQIGVMISGAQLFNDYEDPQLSVVAIDDNQTVTPINGAYFIDSCNGHPLASWNDYHYHGVPYCITDTIDTPGEHSRIIGFIRDGFPVYGPQNTNGEKLTNTDLDECSGHTGPTPEFPNGIYHYHLTDDAAPYSLNCYHGVVTANSNEPGNGGPPNGGGPPDFTAVAATLGVTQEQLTAALGQPPFDLDAVAAKLGVTKEALQAALPPPPDGNGG
jgi:hypothetical protein